MTGPRLLFGAGGTGGHLIPALAVARALRLACPEVDILFAGVGRPAEAELLDPEGWPRVVLAGQGFKGGSFKSKVGSLKSAFVGLGQALKLIRSFKPRLFFGAGGYVTGPVGLAAWLNFKPVVIHEQNSRPGLTNRLLAKVAKEIFVGFPEGLEAFSPDKAVLTGNPLRTEIAALFERKLNYNVRDRFVLLIMGGSQGANRLNVAALDLVAQLAEAGLDFEVIHQTGAKDEAKIDSFYSRLGIKRETKAFFKDPERLYQKAHLAITRAGALTVTELAAVGLPAILVPLPTAADDHQTLNARALVEAGAAFLLSEKDLPELFGKVFRLINNPEKLNAMSGRGRRLVNLKAATRMAERLLALSGVD